MPIRRIRFYHFGEGFELRQPVLPELNLFLQCFTRLELPQESASLLALECTQCIGSSAQIVITVHGIPDIGQAPRDRAAPMI